MENRLPYHLNEKKLWCNRCNRWVDKYTETLVMDDEVSCLICDNWLAGEWDCFGDVSESPAITHIRKEGEKC